MNDLSTKISGDHYFNEFKKISNSFDAKHYDEIQKRKRILLVDDEPDTCMVYQIVLEDAGFECLSYTDSVKALQEFRPAYYDLILISECLY